MNGFVNKVISREERSEGKLFAFEKSNRIFRTCSYNICLNVYELKEIPVSLADSLIVFVYKSNLSMHK